MNLHSLKQKLKNINRQLKLFYKKKNYLKINIDALEEARKDTKRLIYEAEKKKSPRKNKKVKK